ncbi:MAG TPA: HAMP domain-containing sensor histidine kinase [Pyrinomonadaceae bacterium]|nr:HAMP domain-containing sensor histidine kinase [Pyrinomonadaceae bacterium]
MPLSKSLLNSFRVRLLLLLAALLVLTLAAQYYVNLRTARTNTRFMIDQREAILAGVSLGVKALNSNKYLDQLQDEAKQPLLGAQNGRVKNVLIVDDDGNIEDSLDKNQSPQVNPDKTTRYVRVKEISLPPLNSAGGPLSDDTPLPEGMNVVPENRAGSAGAFYFPVETDKGRHYVIVLLDSANTMGIVFRRQGRQALIYTLAVLLAMTGLTAIVVWQFTRPIKSLSIAARRVAGGDFSYRVQQMRRRDEMGELTELFNEMTVKLARTRELEAQLYNAEKAVVVSRLASAIAHEIRNPLNYINLTLDHLQTTFAPNDPQKQEKFESLTKQLKSEVARINDRITEFLNYSRPPKLHPEPVDLEDLARDALRIFEVQTMETGVDARVTTNGNVPQITADPDSLHSALTNLIINGLQAMDGTGGKIEVALSSEDRGRRARIDVIDSGRGIAPDDISKIFEAYYSTKETGTGLGLAIVKKAIEDHHGTITVKSKVGEGTTFTITLPVTVPVPGALATGSSDR